MSATAASGNLRDVKVDDLLVDLQTLARNAITMAFASGFGGSSTLIDGLGPDAIGRLHLLVPSRPRRLTAMLNQRALDRLYSFTPPRIDNAFGHQQIAAAQLPYRSLRLRRHLVQLIDGATDLVQRRQRKPIVGADRLARALGQTAWTDPGFAFDIAIIGRNALIDHVIFSPQPDYPVSLSVEGLWVLIAFAAERSSSLPDDLTSRLVELGNEHAQTPGWAGFWDQFLIRLISDGHRLEQFDPNLFPVVPGKGFSVENKPHPDIVSVLKDDWGSGVPGYAEHLLNRRI